MNGLFFICAIAHSISPLVFLTRYTQNPYSIQILILQSSLLLAWGWIGVLLWKSQPLTWTRTPVDLPFLAFGLWALLTWGFSALRHGSFFRPGIYHEGLRGALFLWVNGLGAFFLSTQMGRDPRSRVLRHLMLGVGAVSAAYGLLQYFGLDPLWSGGINPFAGRPVSTYGNPNFLSSVLVLFLPLALQESISAETAQGAVGWGGLGLLFAAALTATMTRSSWIGAAWGVGAYLILDWPTIRNALNRLGTWMAGVLLLVIFWPASTRGAAVPFTRMAELWGGVTGHTVYASWHQRLLIWRSAWDMWRECPWTGKGWGLFELFFPYYQGRLIPLELFRTFRTHANNAHQLILEVGSQTGLIGLGLILWMAFAAAAHQRKSIARCPPDRKSIAAALLAGVVGMAADNVFGNVSLFFAVPGFLFFWVFGQWAAIGGNETYFFARPTFLNKSLAAVLIVLCPLGIQSLFRRFEGEAAFFRGSQPSRGPNDRSKEEELLLARKWNRTDVHTAFELGNLYLQREESARTKGFQMEVQENAEKAVQAYTDALESNPSYDEIFEARALLYQRLNRGEESERDLRRALLINPLRKETYLALDEILAAKPADPIRLNLLEQAVDLFPEDPVLRLRLARALESQGKSVDAGKIYGGILGTDLENVEAWAGLKRVGDGGPPEIREGKKLLSDIREDARLARWESAHARAERLARLLPGYPLARLIAADTAAQWGDDEAAIRRYREFLQLKPEHPDARENLAKVLDRQGRREEAAQVRKAAPPALPRDAEP